MSYLDAIGAIIYEIVAATPVNFPSFTVICETLIVICICMYDVMYI